MSKTRSLVKWLVSGVYSKKDYDVEKRGRVLVFWKEFYDYVEEQMAKKPYDEKTANKRYKEGVIALLMKYKEENRGADNQVVLNKDKLYKLQLEIENLTMRFDEESMYKSTSDILKRLINPDLECARDFLRTKLTSEEDQELLGEFGQYTLEAIIVYVLCLLFSSGDASNSMIRVAALVEQLEVNVRSQVKMLRQRRSKAKTGVGSPVLPQDSGRKSVLEKKYPIGSSLVEFMEQRDLIRFTADRSGSTRVMKKGSSYYLPMGLYVICNFDISLLPIKLNLPMIYPPLEWRCVSGKERAVSLSDLTGGYLSSPSSEIYNRYKLLSSSNIHHFYIHLKEPERLCNIMNCLQGQPFKINSSWLKYILDHKESFEDINLLKPEFVARINILEVSGKLRDLYMNNEYMKANFTYNELLLVLQKDIQCARYESLIFDLARAYEGYSFYLPAFLDFRGRIYRCGLLHFHERDLSKSLIQFVESSHYDESVAIAATCFQFKSFKSDADALRWHKNLLSYLLHEKGVYAGAGSYNSKDSKSADQLIQISAKAKHPFQFLSGFLPLLCKNFDSLECMPITQDASASAYQIVSYFLLDEVMAGNTNLIQSPNGEIEDIYALILSELKPYMSKKLGDSDIYGILDEGFDRKMVKQIFMPMIYGKTVIGVSGDIKERFSKYLTVKEVFQVSKLCMEFWKDKFHKIDCLMRLICNIGWIASSSGRPVLYEVENFATIQNYVKMEAMNIWVYERLHKKRRQVTLRVATDTQDSRKTEISTFANFIHQKDAHIAMKVVESMLDYQWPIYTVHDNFITTSSYSKNVARIYSRAVMTLGHPLKIINWYICVNVAFNHFEKPEAGLDLFTEQVIPKEELMCMLLENIPKKISSSKRKTWEEKINTIVNTYENYTRIVCGEYENNKKGWSMHQAKYKDFTRMMERKLGIPLYSVHY